MGLKAVLNMTNYNFGCLKFQFNDERESPKYGDGYCVKHVHPIGENALSRITIIKNNLALVGLEFTYRDGSSDKVTGNNGNSGAEGPLNTADIDLNDNEIVVGVTVE